MATEPAERKSARKKEPGERRRNILEMLAAMLENPRGDKVTTSALAARLDVSEAALYRAFVAGIELMVDGADPRGEGTLSFGR